MLSGGRYDALVELFGRKAEATGFAVDVDAVGSCLTTSLPKLELVIHYEEGCLARALAQVDAREAGSSELSPCRTLESTLRLAREKGASQVLVVTADGERVVAV